MKGMRLGLAVILLLMTAGVAAAVDTTNVVVNATVNGTCRFSSAPTVTFPNLDPASGGQVDTAVPFPLVFNCTRGVTYTLGDQNNPAVGDGSYAGTLVGPPGNSIAYTLSYNNFTGPGLGGGPANAITSNISGRILAGAYDLAEAGSYTDTVTFTINP